MSFEFDLEKLYSLLFLAKTEYQTLSLRFVWSRVCVFPYSLGPFQSSSNGEENSSFRYILQFIFFPEFCVNILYLMWKLVEHLLGHNTFQRMDKAQV